MPWWPSPSSRRAPARGRPRPASPSSPPAASPAAASSTASPPAARGRPSPSTARAGGRDGPATIRLGADGAPTAASATGHDYIGAPIDEKAGMEGTELVWRSSAERGRAPRGHAFFMPLAGPFDLDALL